MTVGEMVGAGVVAGLGVAMPLGAIGVLIVREGVTAGFASAASGALAVALVDTFYCAVALGVGAAAGTWLDSLGAFPVLLAGAVLIGLGTRGFVQLRATPPVVDSSILQLSRWRTFATFAGLTVVNPATVIYFLALATALPLDDSRGVAQALFILGVALASLAWQLALAATGSFLRARITPRGQIVVSAAGFSIVIALGVAAIASVLT